jgi:hypothetical protein
MQRGLATILAVAALGTAAVFLCLGRDGSRGARVLRAATTPVLAGSPASAVRESDDPGRAGVARDAQRDAVTVAALPSTAVAVELAAEPPPENGLEIQVRWRADKAAAAGANLRFLEWETLDRVIASEYGNGRRWEAVERFGRSFAADAAGLALVPRPRSWVLVSASAGGGRGRLQLQLDDTGRQVLELEPDRALSVRVHDAQGAPLAGRPVVLRAWRGTTFEDLLLVHSRPDDGIAVLPDVLAAARDTRGPRLAVALPLLGRSPVQEELDLSALPDEPIDLEWPASGSLLLHVERAGGALVSEPVSYTISRSRSPQDGDVASSSWTLAAPEGELAVAGIELGLELRVRAWGPTLGSATKNVSGPRAPDEVVDVRVSTTVRGAVLAGRAVAEDSTPLALADLRARIELEREGEPVVTSYQRLPTDAEGRFRFPVQRAKPGGATRTRLVLALDADGAAREGSIPIDLAAVPDEADVGDVLLTVDPLLAAGRVVDLLGQGIAGARVTVHAQSEDEAQDEARMVFVQHGGTELRALTDRSGAFEARGRVNAPLLELSAFHADYAVSEAVEVPRGSSEVVLVLAASGTIAGRLLLDESIPFDAIQLSPLDARGEAAASNLDREPGGRFELEGLRPGGYSIVARIAGERAELARVDGILAEPLRTTEDPALDPLDLRGKVRAITLTVLDRDGKRIRWIQYDRRVSGDSVFDRQDWWGGHNQALTLYTASRAIDVRLSAQGYRTLELDGLEADTTVTLDPGLPVELVFGAELLAFDREHALSIHLTSALDEQAWIEVEGERTTTLAGSPGRHRLTFFVERDGQYFEFGSDLGLALEVADAPELQTFEVTLSPSALEEARRQVQGS